MTTPEPLQSTTSRQIFIHAMQSERIQIIVGSEKRTFEVPVELLAGCSPVFKAMCYSRFSETTEQLIQFPEVDVDMFAEFFLWVHSYKPVVRMEIFIMIFT